MSAPTTNHFKPGFTTLSQEGRFDSLPISGRLPAWLSGALLRNGPAQFEVGGQNYRHWFDGLGMLHRFAFQGGQVAYACRYLQTNAYRKENAAGKISYRSFATDPCRSLFSRMFALFSTEQGHNANVNLTRLANHYIAMTETPLPVEFDPHTLETLGVYDFDDPLSGQATTAHPHYDFQRGVAINYLLKFGRQHVYQIYGVADKSRRLLARVPVDKPAYMHSFATTERYVILVEFSLVLPNPLPMALGVKPFIENYRWLPERPTRFTIVAIDTGEIAAQVETSAFFAFHHINAFERDDEIVLDISAYPDPDLIQQLYLDHLRADGAFITPGEFRRYRVPLKGGAVSYEILSAETIDLPRIHYARCNGRAYRYAYGAGVRRGEPDFFNQLVKVDTHLGVTKVWHERGCYPGEPVFVAAPDAQADDDGVVLSVVLDGKAGVSFLLVQDGHSFEEIARARVPHPIPFGFHGQFFNRVD